MHNSYRAKYEGLAVAQRVLTWSVERTGETVLSVDSNLSDGEAVIAIRGRCKRYGQSQTQSVIVVISGRTG
jgi:folate-dependent phosphoribosylglycinamide formyltransferase PurN